VNLIGKLVRKGKVFPTQGDDVGDLGIAKYVSCVSEGLAQLVGGVDCSTNGGLWYQLLNPPGKWLADELECLAQPRWYHASSLGRSRSRGSSPNGLHVTCTRVPAAGRAGAALVAATW